VSDICRNTGGSLFQSYIYIIERLTDFRNEVTGGRSSAIAYRAEEERAKRGGWKELWRDSKGWGFGEFVGWIG